MVFDIMRKTLTFKVRAFILIREGDDTCFLLILRVFEASYQSSDHGSISAIYQAFGRKRIDSPVAPEIVPMEVS